MDLTLNPNAIPDAPFAIAFSGGGDSTALLHALRARKPLVLIVDHGLRLGSADEAKTAQSFARSIGLTADVLTWSSPNLTSAIQAKARQARYGLLGEACRARGLQYLLTGHTQDDQAETVLMRIKAGGSWRGGAGMRAVTPAPLWPQLAAVDLCRPMLGVSRANVRQYLKTHQLPFVDDPSNENRGYARIRARDELRKSPPLRRDMLDLSEEMQLGRAAEMQRLAKTFEALVSGDEFGNIITAATPPTRLLCALICAVSGTAERPKGAALARLRGVIDGPNFNGASLGGAIIAPHKNGLIISRDPVIALGRQGVAPLAPQRFSGRTLWDGRFWIEGEGTLVPTGSTSAPPWADAPPPLRDVLKRCPAPARAALPLWHKEGQIIAIGPYGADGQPVSMVKSAVLPRLKREFSTPG